MKKILLLLIGLVVVAILSSEIIFTFLLTPTGGSSGPQVFEVPRGASLNKVAQRLEAAGLVSDAFLFKIYSKMRSSDRGIKMGQYQLVQGQTPKEILAILSSGKSIQYAITFPEGSNIFEVAKKLDETGQFPYEEVLRVSRDQKFIQEVLGEKLSSLEGYLYPETYMYTKYTTVKDLLRSMTERFKNIYAQIPEAKTTSMSRHEVVTLASVIEKETGAPFERPLISSVFHNRIQKRMRLQSDPTIIYGIWIATGKEPFNISRKDILAPTPYNTYTVAKLPFGPIASPGREALIATLRPAQSEFLYFVSKNDGTHVFTKTYEDHYKAVKQFQLDRRAREGKSWRDLNKKTGQ